MASFNEKLQAKWNEHKFVCVGLDPDLSKLPKQYQDGPNGADLLSALFFMQAIIRTTQHHVCAYKPNTAFFEAYGSKGIKILEQLMDFLHEQAPDVPVILDAKRADIGNTNNGYVKFAFDHLGADAITVHPYLGHEAMKPFLDRADKGVIVLARTSNPGAGEFQDEFLEAIIDLHSAKLFEFVAYQVASDWNYNGNCAVVVGATYPEELNRVRAVIGDMPILIPGVGAQGGDLQKSVTNGINSYGDGIIINLSRSVLYASNGPDFAESAAFEVIAINSAIIAAIYSGYSG